LAILRVFTPFSEKRGKRYQDFSQNPGKKPEKAQKSCFRGPGPKRALFGAPARGVLHQPLAPGPRGPGRAPRAPEGPGGYRAGPARLFGSPGPLVPRALPGPRDPGTPARYRGAPARGVDVKPPSRTGPGPGPGVPRGALGPWEASQEVSRTGWPDPGISGSRGPRPGPGRALRVPSPPPGEGVRGVVLHQPLAAGPRGPAGGTPLREG